MTVKRMISGDVLKYRNGFFIPERYETCSRRSSNFALSLPVSRIELASAEIRITLDLHRLAEALNMSSIEFEEIVIDAPIALKRRGVEAKLVVGGDSAMAVEPEENLIKAIATARKWFADLQSGEATSVLELAGLHNVDRSHISRTLPLAFLAPDIVTAIIDGRTEPNFTLSRIKRLKLPASWRDQRQLLGNR